MKRKYGIPDGSCGIYKITNKNTNECYIGQAVDISARLSTHFGRDAKNERYRKWHKFYKDIYELGIENFNYEVLEFCDKDKLLEREQYWYDKFNPSYNVIRPRKFHMQDPISRKHLSETMNSKEHHEKMRAIWDSEEFKYKCRLIHSKGKNKMKPCIMISKRDVAIREFECLMDAARFISNTTPFKGKNKVSKIKSVCDGERDLAYGYKWKYKEV